MPVLITERKSKRLNLPSSTPKDPAWVEIYEEILVEDMLKVGNQGDEIERTLRVISNVIKSWNFTNEKKEVLPITYDNVRFLNAEDFTFIVTSLDLDKLSQVVSSKKKRVNPLPRSRKK